MPAPSRGVEYHDRRSADPRCDQFGCHFGLIDYEMKEAGSVVPGISAGSSVSLDGEHGPLWPHFVRQRDGEESGARVEIGDARSFAIANRVQDGREERLGRATVCLPEHARRDTVGVVTYLHVHCTGVAPHLVPHNKPRLYIWQPHVFAAAP